MSFNNFFWTQKSKERNELTKKYEPVQPFFFISLINRMECDTVIDVGANIGFYSVLSTLCNTVKSVHAFEAIFEAFSEMQKNIEMNGLGEIRSYNVAVSNSDKILPFWLHSDPLSGINACKETTFHDAKKYASEVSVRATALDSVFDFCDRKVAIKIDVEGHELSVLEGAEKLLKRNECFLQVESFREGASMVSALLASYGYHKVYSLRNDIYFSNSADLAGCRDIGEVIRESLNLLIENSLGKFPVRFKNEGFISGSVVIIDSNILNATLDVDEGFFSGQVEFAFYFLIDNIKERVSWYASSNEVSFEIPEGISVDRVAVRGFARDKKYKEKNYQ